MRGIKSDVILKLDESDPHFDNLCIVCKRRCGSGERTKIKACKYTVAVGGIPLFLGRPFMVPAHKNKCKRKLKWQWWMANYFMVTAGTILCVPLLISTIQLKWNVNYFYMSAFAVASAGLFVQIYYVLCGSTFGVLEDAYKNKGEYIFSFKDCEYADAFRRWNAKYVKTK